MKNKIIILIVSFFITKIIYADIDHNLWEEATVKIYSFGMMDAVEKRISNDEVALFAYPELSHGSGFIVSPNGVIITNAHVVKINGEKAESISVKLKDMEKTFPAVLIYSDDESDIAFLKIDLQWKGEYFLLNESTINNSWKKGEKVWLWGFPMEAKEHDVSLSEGIINRTVENNTKIQVSATANPGNSGGPAVDNENRLIGIIHAKIADAENYNLVIPSNKVLKLYNEVVKGGYIYRASNEMKTQRWEIIELYSELGTRMITGKNFENLIEKLYKIANSTMIADFPEALVFFSGIYWNIGMEMLVNNQKDGMDYIISSMKIIKNAISLKPSIRENSFINYATRVYDDIEKENKKSSYDSSSSSRTNNYSSSQEPSQNSYSQSSKNSNYSKNYSGFTVKNVIDLHISFPSFHFYSRKGFFKELMKNEKEQADFEGGPFGFLVSLSFDTNSLHIAEWFFLLSGLTLNANTEQFIFTDKETNEEKTINQFSLGMTHGLNFRPVRWFYATLYWYPQIWVDYFNPKGFGVNLGFVWGRGFVFGMKGGFYEDNVTKAYAHFCNINIGWAFRMGRW